ncbi:substrate-binding periplasmic protein [Psychromonas aquimarina]|uniref:substrate-binding periplasmic protein n=1 Tax=Psychromonas aquimarina TaxID=444919 RepID=UPI000406BCBF|nr:transporter substrate-binding domain-containing protein [Psychromonas aquimarina]
MPRFIKMLFAVLISFSSTLQAAETLIFYAGAPPLSYAEDNQPKGLYFDIVTTLFDEMEVEYNVIILPFKRALLHTYEGKGIVIGIYKTEERALRLDYSDSLHDSKAVLFINKARPFSFLSMSDLKGKTIAVKLGWSYGAAFDQAKQRSEFQTVHGDAQRNFRLVIEGRADAFVDDRLPGITTIKEMGIAGQIDTLPRPVNIGKLYIAVKKGTNSQLIQHFNYHLQQFKTDGRYQAILAKYQ